MRGRCGAARLTAARGAGGGRRGQRFPDGVLPSVIFSGHGQVSDSLPDHPDDAVLRARLTVTRLAACAGRGTILWAGSVEHSGMLAHQRCGLRICDGSMGR